MRRLVWMAAISVVLAMGCGDPTEEKPDGGVPDGGPGELTAQLGTFEGANFRPLEETGELEIISGFQGGWHVEPLLLIDGVGSKEILSGTLLFVVERESSSEEVGAAPEQEVEPVFWDNYQDDSYLFLTQPVFLNFPPDQLVGERVVLEMTLSLTNGEELTVSQQTTLKDDFEEANF